MIVYTYHIVDKITHGMTFLEQWPPTSNSWGSNPEAVTLSNFLRFVNLSACFLNMNKYPQTMWEGTLSPTEMQWFPLGLPSFLLPQGGGNNHGLRPTGPCGRSVLLNRLSSINNNKWLEQVTGTQLAGE